MTTNDYQWLPMTTNDYQWLPMTTSDYQWLSKFFSLQKKGEGSPGTRALPTSDGFCLTVLADITSQCASNCLMHLANWGESARARRGRWLEVPNVLSSQSIWIFEMFGHTCKKIALHRKREEAHIARTPKLSANRVIRSGLKHKFTHLKHTIYSVEAPNI